ncbi:MAG: hypothetical protein RJA70_176 [Pseudomonadota bacterium]|jgi:hypothetical protein
MTPLRQRLWSNWLLVVIALVLATLVIGTQNSVTSAEREARARHLMLSFHEQALSAIELQTRTERIGIIRGTGAEARWLLKAPLHGEADEASVDQLLRNLRYATWLRQVPTDTPRAGLGLDTPEHVIELFMGEVRVRLRLGARATDPADARYMEVAGEGAPNKGVYVVSESTARDLSLPLLEFRARQLSPYGSDELAQIEVTRHEAGERRSFRMKDHGEHWRFQGSLDDALIDRFVMDRLFIALSGLQVQRFVKLETARELQAALEPGALTELVFTPAKSDKGPGLQPLRLSLGGECPGDSSLQLAVREGPEAVGACVRAAELQGVLSSRGHWVDRRLFQARADEVEQIEISQGDRRLEVVRREDGFLMRAPEEAAVEPEAGQRLLSELTDATGSVVSKTPQDGAPVWSPAVPAHRVRLSRIAKHEQEPIAEVLEVGAPAPDGSVLVRRESDGLLLLISRQNARQLGPNKLLLKERQLLDVTTERIRRVILTDPAQELVQTQRGVFELKQPNGYEPDGGLAYDLLTAISQLTAERWVSELADESMGFERASRLTIEYEPKGKAQFEIGARASGGGYYARIGGDPAVFILRGATQEALSTWLLDRSAFLIDPTQTEHLRLETSNGASATFERGADQLVLSRAEPEMDSKAAQEILTTLGLLRSEAAISLTGAQSHHGFDRPVLEATVTARAVGAEAKSTRRWQVGAGDTYRGLSIYYARIVGDPAIYALPRQSVQQILGAM